MMEGVMSAHGHGLRTHDKHTQCGTRRDHGGDAPDSTTTTRMTRATRRGSRGVLTLFAILGTVVVVVAAAAPADDDPGQGGPPPSGTPPSPDSVTEQNPDPPTPAEPLAEPGCPPCKPARCPSAASECAAGVGLAADPCGCCPGGVCGLAVGARCYNASSASAGPADRALGACGDNMDCLPRLDLEHADEPESLCVCRDAGQVCGSDNATYASSCQMVPAVPARGQDEPADEPPVRVWLKHRGPCRAAPWIVTPPVAMPSRRGSSLSLECEVKGYPPPSASWEKIDKDGIAIQLPGDNAELVVMVRGGPEPFMATTWLQIMALGDDGVGTYICVANNSEGAARVAVSVSML